MMMSEEYVIIGGTECPSCGSADLSCIDTFYNGPKDYCEEIQCLSCGGTWIDVYALTGYIDFAAKNIEEDRECTNCYSI